MKNHLTTFLCVILALTLITTSCSKDKSIILSDSLPGNGVLKSAFIKGSSLNPLEQLGKAIYFDKISVSS